MKFRTTKIISNDPYELFTKICTHENNPLYGITTMYTVDATYVQGGVLAASQVYIYVVEFLSLVAHESTY